MDTVDEVLSEEVLAAFERRASGVLNGGQALAFLIDELGREEVVKLLKASRDDLFRQLEERGGRGVDLAEQIDAFDKKIGEVEGAALDA